MDLPVATDQGKPITGLVRCEYILEEEGVTTQPLSGWASTRSHPTVSFDTRQATLTRRQYGDFPREVIPPDQWMFARDEGGSGLDGVSKQTAIVPSDSNLYLPGGFEPGWIYELVYTGKDPLVLGLGHTAVRDFISFLKYDASDDEGTPNPLGSGKIEKAYGWGRSQTGRAIRDFVYHGYNEDLKCRKVFDGLLPHVSGAGLLWMNHRFANAVSPAGQEHEVHHNCADRFPFSYTETTDHLTGGTMLTTVAAGRVFDYNYCIGMYAMNGQGFWTPQDFAFAPNGHIYIINRGVEEVGPVSYTHLTLPTILLV